MRTGAILICLALASACRPATPDEGAPSSTVECVEESLTVEFGAAAVDHEQVHLAVADLAGTYQHEATWLGEGAPRMVTTTVTFIGESYELMVSDQDPACLILIEVPVQLTVATDDGRLLFDAAVVWGQRRITQPTTQMDEIELGASLSTSPDGSDWLDMAVHEIWPDIAAPEDDAELVLEVSKDGGTLVGLLYYSKRELIDGTTVIYDNTTLLEWGDP